MRKTVIAAIGLAAVTVGCATPIQILYDAEVDRLCATEGGIKVHKSLKLSSDKFDKYGHINFFKPWENTNALGPDYIFVQERQTLKGGKNGAASVAKGYAAVYLKASNELLGEATWFGRGGGDFPGPGHPSNYVCPDNGLSLNPLFETIFKKSGGEVK